MALMVGRAQAMNFEVLKKRDCAAVSAAAYQTFLQDMTLTNDQCDVLANAVWDACDAL